MIDLANTTLLPQSVFHGIKAAWLMRGAIAEMDNAATSADRKYHLGRDDVWDLGKRLGISQIAGMKSAHLSLKLRREDCIGGYCSFGGGL